MNKYSSLILVFLWFIYLQKAEGYQCNLSFQTIDECEKKFTSFSQINFLPENKIFSQNHPLVNVILVSKNTLLTQQKLDGFVGIQWEAFELNSSIINALLIPSQIEVLKSWTEIESIQVIDQPTLESNVPDHDLSVNTLNWVHTNYPLLNGQGIEVSIKEDAFDSTDLDLYPRAFQSNLASTTMSTHASAMAAIISGAGNSSSLSRGAAKNSTLYSSDFRNLLPDPLSYFQNYSINIQNHSYGLEINNQYDALAQAYDLQTNANENLLHIFSAGNLGLTTPENGKYASIEKYSNLSGSFKMAKNIMLVGATNQFGQLDVRSSRGPAYDGRIKPEIIAYGATGTSDAAALVSGTAILLSELFENKNGKLPSSAQLKAFLIASANSLSEEKVSFESGFGALNAKGAIEVVDNANWIEGTIISNETLSFDISIPENTSSVRFAMVWNDPAGEINQSLSLVNNLDLKVIELASTTEWQPWVLDASTDINSLRKPAVRGFDNLNNVELITISEPASGDYQIEVDAANLSGNQQKFSIAYSLVKKDHFEWTYPSSLDVLTDNEVNVLRFENNFTQNGELSVRFGNSEWKVLGEISPLGKYFLTQLDTSTTAQFKAVFGQKEFISDSFVISPKVDLNKVYGCGNEYLFNWPAVLNASAYELSQINASGRLEPFMVTSDTFALIDLLQHTASFSSISMKPIIDDSYGQQVNIYNFQNDGIGCFLRSFNASVTEERVDLSLVLSTDYNVTSIDFQKWNGSEFVTFASESNITNSKLIEASDINEYSGYFIYRAQINLQNPINDSSFSLTEPIELAVIIPETISVFPNPLEANEDLNILSEASSLRGFVIRNISGAKVEVDYITSGADSFTIRGLASGFYIYQIFDFEGKLAKTGKLIVQ
uniref:S8 family peptidase n=4 Tax=Roseivirga sp. TaxID=1964215 RepID=UPI0040486127